MLWNGTVSKDYKEEFKIVTDFYSNDFYPDLLAAQLLTFRAQQYKEIKLNGDMITTLNEIIKFRRNPGYAGLLSEISLEIKKLCKR